MATENEDTGGFRGEIVMLAREMAVGARDGLLAPANLVRSAHERWGIKGVLGALGLTVLVSFPSFALAWDIPRGTALAVITWAAGGVGNRLEKFIHSPPVSSHS